MKYEITVKTASGIQTLPAGEGDLLLNVLRAAGVPMSAPCGGNGSCGQCRVLCDGKPVLACQTTVVPGCTVEVRELSGGSIAGAEKTAAPVPEAGNSESKSKLPASLAAAVDLGTTTVVVELLNTETGNSLGIASAWNAQAAFGADVITRCQYCMEHPDGLQELKQVIREQIHGLIRSLGAEPENLQTIFIAGNTVMQHLYAGISPVGIAVAPFRPAVFFTGDEPRERGVRYAPCVAGYIGGDITAGLLASGLRRSGKRALFLDIGTNGEMALCKENGFLGCAVASGPAFEGVGIACGMPGITGAVSHVRWDGEKPELEVVGNAAPRGICGSGLIDLLARLLEKRLISGSGRLCAPDEAPEGYENYLGEDEKGNGIFYLTEDHSVYLTAGDVRKLQLAKAAVAAGIAVLLKEARITAEDLDALYLAGGFGTYMDIRSAAAIGMLPACLTERAVLLGNSSLTGAAMVLLQPEAEKELEEIRRSFRYLELSGNADFNREYPEQMFFYEEDDDEWN